jgi:predicted phosphoadenosine phosphosulfate sulfurtransferase
MVTSKKIYLEENVYIATMKRIELLFNEFDNIVVSFSGGKDSGVMLNLMFKYMRENNIAKKIIVYYLDYEGSYDYTEDFIKRMVEQNHDLIELYWVCLTYKTKCGCSMFRNYWLPWNDEEKEIWVRDFPVLKNELQIINKDNHEFDFYFHGIEDTDFDKQFIKWIHKQKNANKTADLIGIRTQESLNRWRAISVDKKEAYNGLQWTNKVSNNIYNAYIMYDWTTEDIWVANAKFEFDYNKLYDLYYQAGLNIEEMRVASAFIDEGVSTLNLHKAIEPNKWCKLVGRVNGANFGAIYGDSKARGFKEISLPLGHTWKSYCDFLLNTLPLNTADIFKEKFKSTFKVWLEKGATVLVNSIPDIEKSKYNFKILGKPTGKLYENRDDVILIKFDEYPDDIDSKYFVNLPSYKRMCITILKNDTSCKYMGYGMTNFEKQKRHDAMQKYKNI